MKKFKPEILTQNTCHLMVGYTDIGIYTGPRATVLIDTGSEPDPEFIRWLLAQGITPDAVINTHLHIDHIGGNEMLRQQFSTRIYAAADEIRHENDAGYQEGKVAFACPEGARETVTMEIAGEDFEIISLPGHSAGHQAVATPDGVCFIGDAIMCREKLRCTKMPYHLNMAQALESMDRLQQLDYSKYVLSHSGAYAKSTLREIARENIHKERLILSMLDDLMGGAGAVGAASHLKDEKLAGILMDRLGISREKQDVGWVFETALARVEMLRG